MKLITGGAFEGKTGFAVNNFGVCFPEIKDGEKCIFDEVFSAECVNNYHILVKRLLSGNIDPTEFTERLCKENNNIIVIMNEVGCGIVPVEKSERLWRETCGKCGCMIAENADTVVRVTCGIGTAIKGEL